MSKGRTTIFLFTSEQFVYKDAKLVDDNQNRLFIEFILNEVDKSKASGCKTVKGTCKTHYVLGFSHKDTTQLLFRSLPWFLFRVHG